MIVVTIISFYLSFAISKNSPLNKQTPIFGLLKWALGVGGILYEYTFVKRKGTLNEKEIFISLL